MPGGQKHCISFHNTGTMASDLDIRWTAHDDCTLVHVCAVSTNAAAASLKIGTPADDDAYLELVPFGYAGIPLEFDFNDFATYATSRSFPRIAKGSVVMISVGHNYNGGGIAAPSANPTIVLTLIDE